MIIDLYSRKIVGWEVWEKESGEHAATLVDRAVLAEQCRMDLRVLHADNGAIQKSSTLQVKLEGLGVMASFNRPRVSNDNAYSESLFRTCKYRPDFPQRGFASIEAARSWVLSFVHWYNNVHRHSALKYVTPAQRHAGLDIAILAERRRVYEAAKKKHPSRWSRHTRNWNPVTEVHLNKRRDEERMMVMPATQICCAPTMEIDLGATVDQPSRNQDLIAV
jgi:transposase InsO family protein